MSGGNLRTVTVCCKGGCSAHTYNLHSQKWQKTDGCDAKESYAHHVCGIACERECDHYDHDLKIHFLHQCLYHTPKDNCSLACPGRVKLAGVDSSPS